MEENQYSQEPEKIKKETAGPTHKMWLIWSAIAFTVVVIVVVIILFINAGNGSSADNSTIVTESESKHETFNPVSPRNDTSELTYGKWTGELKYGQPHGQGTLTYSKQRLISQFDTKGTVAQPGDYVIGEFAGGQLITGKLYRTSGEVVDLIISTPSK